MIGIAADVVSADLAGRAAGAVIVAGSPAFRTAGVARALPSGRATGVPAARIPSIATRSATARAG